MPQLPIYDSKRRANARTLGPVDTGRGQVVEQNLKRAKQVNALAQEWAKTQRAIQYTVGKSNYEMQINNYLTEAQNDPSYNNSDEYLKDIEKSKKEVMGSFTSDALSPAVIAEFNLLESNAKAKVSNIYRKKQITQAKVSLNDSNLLGKKKYITAPPVEKPLIQQEQIALNKTMLDRGIITAAQYESNIDDIREWDYDMVLNHAAINPIATYERLKNEEYGIKKQNPKKWAELKEDTRKKAEKRIEEQDFKFKLEQNKNEQQLVMQSIEGNVSEATINEAEAKGEAGLSGGISKGTAASLRRLIKSKKTVDSGEKTETYSRLTAMFSNLGLDNEAIPVKERLKGLAKFRGEVIEAARKGELPDSKARNFIDKIQFVFTPEDEKVSGEEVPNMVGLHDALRKRYNNFRTALGAVRWWKPEVLPQSALDRMTAAIQHRIMTIDKIEDFNHNDLLTEVDRIVREEIADRTVAEVDKYGFIKGEEREVKGIIYKYQGGDRWLSKKE